MPDTFYYTRCPAPTSTGVSAGLGILQERLAGLGLRPQALQDVEDPEILRHHFEHGIPNLLREGGNIPPIWARANGARTRLLGITWLDEFQAVLVRADAPAQTVADLAGKCFAVPQSTGHRLDVARITALRGIAQGLRSAGLTVADVTLVDAPPQAVALGARGKESFDAELALLDAGAVDAVWVKSAAGAAAVRSGRYRVVLRIDRLADPLLRVNNGTPRTLTFHEDFIAARPDVVRDVVESARRAVDGIAQDRERLWGILARETGQDPADAATAFEAFTPDNLIPDLTPGRLAALQDQADFLFDQGFIPKRVDVSEWALDWRDL
ncbi:ABC transporter substrate-binding protein [Paenirhodobacter populi]|uniref:ABC transporter substrate-binding protein n=1 Tax=Paenirhodobacter populi TaxID=2306993 RepID=UPI000FE2AC3A|nr:ABC transporter substrate-binding protein [Sinirhodobacter populi]RWR04572.1 ABC transporter substrate-binding protein [Sinirhodobacter populi]